MKDKGLSEVNHRWVVIQFSSLCHSGHACGRQAKVPKGSLWDRNLCHLVWMPAGVYPAGRRDWHDIYFLEAISKMNIVMLNLVQHLITSAI